MRIVAFELWKAVSTSSLVEIYSTILWVLLTNLSILRFSKRGRIKRIHW